MANVMQTMVLVLLAMPSIVAASDTANKSLSVDSQQVFTGHKNLQSAEAFGITEKEWTRYKSIMDGEGRFHWKGVDPIVVLGIYSKNESQRKRYAEIMARKEHELNKLFIDFNQAYIEAFQRLYGDEQIMDLTKVAAYQNQFNLPPINSTRSPSDALKIGDRIVLFINTDCSSCDEYFSQVRSVQGFSALDIYFVNDSNNEITQWAKRMGITPDQVKSGSVTLNRDGGMYAKYGRPGVPSSFYYNHRDQSVSAFMPE